MVLFKIPFQIFFFFDWMVKIIAFSLQTLEFL